MSHDLLDIVGRIDETYIEEASGRPIQEKRRRPWLTAAAAVLALVIAGGSAWLLLRSVRRGPGEQPIGPAASASEPVSEQTDPEKDQDGPSDEVDPRRNQLALDFEAAIAAANSEDFTEACRYVQSLTPSEKNDMTGLLAGKNLILITAQNFCPQVIDPERTPTLYRLATQGIEFTDYYQPDWGGATATGEFAVLTGLVPAHGVQSIRDTVGKDMRLTLGNQLLALDYHSWAFCDESADTFRRTETHGNLGYEKVQTIGSGLEEHMTKQHPYSDREMMLAATQFLYDWTPCSAYLMMCSGLGAYNRAGNAMAAKHWAEVEELSCSDTVKAYLAANMEVELALRDLVEGLEQLGVADDYVIVLTSSQYPYALEKSEDWGNAEDYLAELYGKPVETCFDRDRSTLIIWSGCLEGKGYKVTTPTSSLDIVPTLSNLFGLEYDSRLLVGRDVFSEQEPLVLWPDGSWKTDKYSYNQDTREYFSADGAPCDGTDIPYEYVMAQHDAVEAKIRFSDTVLNTDLYRLLLAQGDPSVEEAMEEIQAELGYGYSLPDESQYTGSIVPKLEKPANEAAYLSLKYTADAFDGVVYVTKKQTDPAHDVAEDWTELTDAGTRTVDGIEVHFLGSNPYNQVVAYWEENGFTYTVKGEIGTTPAMLPLIRLFNEKGRLDIDPVETVNTEAVHQEEASMEEIEAALGYGYALPDESEYSGTIHCYFEETDGEKTGIYLVYSLDDASGRQVYISKHPDDGSDDYDSWDQYYEAGSEVVDGVEVRFRDVFEASGHRSIAFWKQNGYSYILNCAPSALDADIMELLALFLEA